MTGIVELDDHRPVSARSGNGKLAKSPRSDTAPASLLDACGTLLAQGREQMERDPFANAILLTATAMQRHIDEDAVGEEELEGLIQRLSTEAFQGRAQRIGRYLGEIDVEANTARIRDLIHGLGAGPDAATVPFATFQERVQRIYYGFVITAHPTFSLNVALLRDLITLALGVGEDGVALTDATRDALLARVESSPHRPEPLIDLEEEYRQAHVAIRAIQAAIRRAHGIVLDVAAGLYPDQWRDLTPRLVSLASWVGYDTDGRSDIPWTLSFAKRLDGQLRQLQHYRESVANLRGRLGAGHALASTLELIEVRLQLGVKAAEDELEVFAGAAPNDAAWRERLAKASRQMYAGLSAQVTDAGQLVELVGRALSAAEDPAIARELCLLRAEIATFGLVTAQTHVRINATQLHNAIRKTIGMDHAPDDPGFRMSYAAAVADLIKDAKPLGINFGSALAEKTTARRVFMTIAQMLKYLDRAEPIRFLIAECETALTLLTALYFAKLFGVDERIDISPLFETRTALERGASVIEGALEVDAYRDYIVRRGRLCIQTGFSDAGRYMGQIAACAAIEKIRLGLCSLLARRGMTDVEVIIFDTHGESIGRGSHPGSFADRFAYYGTPESLRRFAAAGIGFRQETSYQGSDSYLYFLREQSAFAILTRVLEHTLAPLAVEDDAFYAEGAYVDEFFAAIREFNATVIDDPDYAAFLGAFGPNMLYPTGSRSLKRQHDTSVKARLEHPSQLRAIPHNSILQQMGILANTIGGVGMAVAKDPERFQMLYRESPRFRRLMTMVEHAFKFTDLDVVRAYVDLFDPGMWLARARRQPDEAADQFRAISVYMERLGLHEQLIRVLRVFERDYMALATALREHRRRTRDAGEEPIAVDAAARDNMHMLHAVRLALLAKLILRAARVPDFSDRHAQTHDSVILRLFQLDVEPALALLTEVFPLSEKEARALDYGEPATYQSGESQSYAQEHAQVFAPIARYYDLIRRIGTGVIHHIGAIG